MVLQKQTKLSYSGIHKRLYTQRGSASSYLCTVCGEQAHEWACNDPSAFEVPKNGRMIKVSMHLDLYIPLCRSCHKKKDYKDEQREAGHPRAKLTREQIDEIRFMSKYKSHQEIADQFGLSQSYVSKIVRKEYWK